MSTSFLDSAACSLKTHCTLLQFHVIIAYFVDNFSTLNSITFNELFVIIVILLPKILEQPLSNEYIYNLLVKIENNGTLTP